MSIHDQLLRRTNPQRMTGYLELRVGLYTRPLRKFF